MARVVLALDGLSVGDAFGERFFTSPTMVESLIAARALPAAPWRFTDDTVMALVIAEILDERTVIERDALAARFAARYVAEPDRGYGGTAHSILGAIARGEPWREVAGAVFGGAGSMGNGGGMRAAPIGAYFAGDGVDRVIAEARASAEVTHAHPDGQAGAIAVAIAAAWACERARGAIGAEGMLAHVFAHTPAGDTRDGLARALALPPDATVADAVLALGSGRKVISSDTVPFSLWCAERGLDDYVECMWTTVSGLGDRDTTCAIAGGIVALAGAAIPAEWLSAREPLGHRFGR